MTDRTSNPRRRKRASKAASQTSVSSPQSRTVGKLRTIDELADRWDVSARTVQRLIRSGALRIHRIRRLVRISDADAAAFLEDNRDD